MLDGRKVLDAYFPEVRAKLIEIAAVLDRYDRAVAERGNAAEGDQRLAQYLQSLEVLTRSKRRADRAEQIQRIFSDPV